MPLHDPAVDEYVPSIPSMLDLVRMSPRRIFPPGGVELYRQIALLTELSPEDEVLSVACGKGVSLGYFVQEHGVTASGVDIDPRIVEDAEAWSRDEGIADRLQFQVGRSDSLPYRDEIFDLVIGEIGLANHCEPEDAVSELVRVTKPGGFVVLLQLVWKAPVDEERKRVLSEHLGARPMMLVEWKRLLREAGVVDVHTEDWSDEQTSFRPTVVKPFPDFSELFSLPERIGILRRAWRRWGVKGVSNVLSRENEVHKLLTNERILGLDLLRGRKGPVEGRVSRPLDAHTLAIPEPVSASDARPVPASVAAPGDAKDATERRARDTEPAETRGLPLFGAEERDDSEDAEG